MLFIKDISKIIILNMNSSMTSEKKRFLKKEYLQFSKLVYKRKLKITNLRIVKQNL